MRIKLVALLAAIATGPVSINSALAEPVERRDDVEVLDVNSARAHATKLIPIMADEVVEGERGFVRGFPTGHHLGLFYRFRLRPRPVEYRPWCEKRVIAVWFLFSQEPVQVEPLEQYDLLATKRSGGFKSATQYSHSYFLELSPAPNSEEEKRARCIAATEDENWVQTNEHEFGSERWHIKELRKALENKTPGLKLVCSDHGKICSTSSNEIIRTIEQKRRDFKKIYLSNNMEWVQYTYSDDVPYGGSQEMRSVILEIRSGEMISVTLVIGTITSPVI